MFALWCSKNKPIRAYQLTYTLNHDKNYRYSGGNKPLLCKSVRCKIKFTQWDHGLLEAKVGCQWKSPSKSVRTTVWWLLWLTLDNCERNSDHIEIHPPGISLMTEVKLWQKSDGQKFRTTVWLLRWPTLEVTQWRWNLKEPINWHLQSQPDKNYITAQIQNHCFTRYTYVKSGLNCDILGCLRPKLATWCS